MPINTSTVKTITKDIQSTTSIDSNQFDFNSMLMNPDAKSAFIELENKNSDGTNFSVETVSLSTEEFDLYFKNDPETAPLALEATKATRKAWIAILQKKGILPAGEITDTYPV